MAVNPHLVDDLAEQVMYAGAPGMAEQQSFFMDVMEAVPTMSTAAMVKSSRGGSTLMYGGRADRGGLFGRRPGMASTFVAGADGIGSNAGLVRGGLRNLMYRPANVRSFATRDYFGATPIDGGRTYNPFYGSSILNAPARVSAGISRSERMNARFGQGGFKTGLAGTLSRHGMIDQESGEVVSRGFASRIASSARIGAMSQTKFAGASAGMIGFLEDAYSATPGSMKGMGQLGVAQMTAMSGSGPLTSRLGAWAAASQGNIGVDVTTRLNTAAGETARGAAAAKAGLAASHRANAARQLAGVGSARVGVSDSLMRAAQHATHRGGGPAAGANLKLAGGAALRVGARFAGPIGWGLLARDVGRFAGRTTARTVSTAIAAVGSYTSPTRTGIMQQSFTDNEVTRTSRARGVNAIQNSRLNSRSVLGNESAAMAAHFG